MSLDLLVVLCLTWLMPLETATLVSRALYVALVVAYVAHRIRSGRSLPSWPSGLGAHRMLLLTTSTAVALIISLWISRQWFIWDRTWHIPLVTSIRGQTLPFRNVFNAHEVLHYHFSGDVQAAMLQALSGSVLHSSLALSLLHDVHFALIGLTLGCFLAWWGYRRVGEFALASASLVLTGPVHIFREGVRTPQEGHSFVSYLSFSFRPHDSLAGLLMLGFVGAIIARLGTRRDIDWRATAPALCLCTAALSITDETSIGMLGLTLGVTWLYAPRVIGESRKVGVVVLVVLVAAVIVPNLVFCAGLSPGGEHHTFRLVPWRSPGYYRDALPLTTRAGRVMLFFDMFAPIAVCCGWLMHRWTIRDGGRRALGAYFTTLMGLSIFAVARFEIDGVPTESHRFGFAVLFLAPFVGLALLKTESFYGTLAILTGVAAAALSTLDWGFNYLPDWGLKRADFSTYDLYETDCRTVIGSRLGTRARTTYVTSSLYYLATGCLSTYTPGFVQGSNWKSITIGSPFLYTDAVVAIEKELPTGASMPLVCPNATDPNDGACAVAEKNGSCHAQGLVAKDCALTAREAADFME
jgi:hypothetical protein